MNKYIDSLKTFLEEQTPNFTCTDANSILEMLYYFYAEANPVDSAVIRCQFKELDAVLSKLSWNECERVFSLAVGLCVSYTQQAFLDGVHVGMRLFTELQDEQNDESLNPDE